MRVGIIVKIRQDGGELLDVVAYDANLREGANQTPVEMLIPVETPSGEKLVVRLEVFA